MKAETSAQLRVSRAGHAARCHASLSEPASSFDVAVAHARPCATPATRFAQRHHDAFDPA